MRFLSLRKPRSARRGGVLRTSGVLGQLAVTALFFGLCVVLIVRLDGIGMRSLAGTPIVHDGDTLTVGGERIRLAGVDAFELDQTCVEDGVNYSCGETARAALMRLVDTGEVICDGKRRDRYRRLLAVCSTNDIDLNREMVSAGWAVSYGAYRTAEIAARLSGRGAWGGQFAAPAEWRAAQGRPAEARHDIVSRLLDTIGQYLLGN